VLLHSARLSLTLHAADLAGTIFTLVP
jgi:hypothetical protein